MKDVYAADEAETDAIWDEFLAKVDGVGYLQQREAYQTYSDTYLK